MPAEVAEVLTARLRRCTPEFIAKECFWQIQERLGQELETPIVVASTSNSCMVRGAGMAVTAFHLPCEVYAESTSGRHGRIAIGGADRYLDPAVFSKRFLDPACAVLANCLRP